MGTHLIGLSKGFPFNTNMAGIKRFSNISCYCAFDESSLKIERFNILFSVPLDVPLWPRFNAVMIIKSH